MKIPALWTFRSEEVARGFDAHVREQLPWYDIASAATAHIAISYLPDGGRVYDIGASTGNLGRRIEPALRARSAELVAVESSPEMAARYDGPGRLVIEDACELAWEPADVIVFFLCLQFVPVARRGGLIRAAVSALRPGGVVVIVDRFHGFVGYPSRVFYRLGLAVKAAAGVAPDAILEKELSLAGAQRSLSEDEVPAGSVEWFRIGDFRGFLIER